MATSSRAIAGNPLALPQRLPDNQVRDLLKLQKLVQSISSTLDLQIVIDRVVVSISKLFGCVEANVFLYDGIHSMVLAGTHGCTLHSKGHSLKIGQEGIVGHVAFTREVHYAPDVRKDSYYIPCEEKTLSEVAIPLEREGTLIGVLTAACPELDGFSPQELELLQLFAGHIAVAVKNAQCFEQERVEKERMSMEEEEARHIQQLLLPNSSLLLPGFYATGMSIPARAVGGDWYDYIALHDGKWGFVLADVSGKGMSAAMLMSATRSTLRYLAQNFSSPAEVLTRLNRHIVTDLPGGRFVTMVYGVLDPVTRTFTFANAGHPLPLLKGPAMARFLETESGLPLGLSHTSFTESTLDLTEGSRLLLYTDGITEAENEKQEEYGTIRLADQMAKPEVSTEAILNNVREFTDDKCLADDATVLLIATR